MKKGMKILSIAIITVVAIPTWPVEAASKSPCLRWKMISPVWPDVGENLLRVDADITAVTVLRAVVLYRADRQQESISANLVYVDQEMPEEMIQYNGNLYPISPLAGNSSFDSQVIIDSQLYLFRCKLRPYEC